MQCNNLTDIGENALSGPERKALKRLPAHRALWFGWVLVCPSVQAHKRG